MKKKIEVTIAIPTFKRANLLAKALKCLEMQTFKNFKVSIAVNGNNSDVIDYKKLEQLYLKNNNIKFYYHYKNIAIIDNFLFLLSESTTKYFMWLADDDLISPHCLEVLVKVLDFNGDAVTAVPYWKMNDENGKQLIIPSHFHQNNFIQRIIKFCDNSDDVFFYGLHRTENLKKCTFEGFWRPNSELIEQWAYVFIFDLLMQGKILFKYDKNAIWINNHTTTKQYSRDHRTNLTSKIKKVIKMINMNYLFIVKIIKWKKSHFVPIMVLFLIKNMILFLINNFFKPIFIKVFKSK